MIRQDSAVLHFVTNLSVVGKTALSLTADGNEICIIPQAYQFFCASDGEIKCRDIMQHCLAIEEKMSPSEMYDEKCCIVHTM